MYTKKSVYCEKPGLPTMKIFAYLLKFFYKVKSYIINICFFFKSNLLNKIYLKKYTNDIKNKTKNSIKKVHS